jgi:hypothetical protein
MTPETERPGDVSGALGLNQGCVISVSSLPVKMCYYGAVVKGAYL